MNSVAASSFTTYIRPQSLSTVVLSTWQVSQQTVLLFLYLSLLGEKRLLAACPPVRPYAWNNSAPTGQIFVKLDIWASFENLSIKFNFHYNPIRITGILHESVFTFMRICRWILRIRNVSDKSCRQNQNIHFIIGNLFRKSCRLWDNVEKSGGAREAADDDMAARCVLEE